MSPKQYIPFHFHAEAHALSAKFTRPVAVPIEALAATSLPSIGGHAHARVENFNVPRLVSFKSAHTHVSGSWQDEDTATTQVTTVIEGVRILDFVTADRIVARLTAEHKRDQKEGHFLALGSTFENLRIGGQELKVTLRHDLFLECETFDALKKRVARDAKPEKMSVTDDGVALCSLVEKIEPGKLPGVEMEGHILRIRHFGEISLAEVFTVPGTRTLTMLRLKLGSPDAGDGTVAEATINGQPMPPGPGG